MTTRTSFLTVVRMKILFERFPMTEPPGFAQRSGHLWRRSGQLCRFRPISQQGWLTLDACHFCTKFCPLAATLVLREPQLFGV
jgi:hypothetical protein